MNVVIAKFMHTNRLRMNMESRIHGDVYVRFGGEYVETCRLKGRQGATCLACGATPEKYVQIIEEQLLK